MELRSPSWTASGAPLDVLLEGDVDELGGLAGHEEVVDGETGGLAGGEEVGDA